MALSLLTPNGESGASARIKINATITEVNNLSTNPGGVTSVNTKTGDVVLTSTDIGEGSNLYWTQSRFDTAIQTVDLNDLNDVAITSPQPLDRIIFDGTNWVNDGKIAFERLSTTDSDGRDFGFQVAGIDRTSQGFADLQAGALDMVWGDAQVQNKGCGQFSIATGYNMSGGGYGCVTTGWDNHADSNYTMTVGISNTSSGAGGKLVAGVALDGSKLTQGVLCGTANTIPSTSGLYVFQIGNGATKANVWPTPIGERAYLPDDTAGGRSDAFRVYNEMGVAEVPSCTNVNIDTVGDKALITKEYISTLITDSHTHTNKSVIDTITTGNITDWDQKEDGLGLPTTSGQVLSSDLTGNRTWVDMSGGSYTAGTGLDLTGSEFSLDALIQELSNVNTSGVSDGQVLTYEHSTTSWVPTTVSGGTGFSPYISDGTDGFVIGNWIDENGDTGTKAEGTDGTNGTDGADGTNGIDGAQGPKGEKGNTGATGADSTVPGPTGPKGEKGNPGNDGADSVVPGPQGPAGADSVVPGPTGPQGLKGDQGIDGPQGPQGPAGNDGAKGDDGADGPQGPKGDDGADGTGVSIKGSLPYADILAISGTAGDMYIVTDTSTNPPVYAAGDGFVSNGQGSGDANWDNVGPIKGPKGDTGPTGLTGPQGQKGDKGDQGIDGPTGPAGVNGADGADGADSVVPGPQGIQGTQGPKGDKGDQGLKGDDGADSVVPGPTGPQGNDGADSVVPGPQGIQGQKGDKGDKGNDGADSVVPGPTGPAGNDGADSTVPGPQGPAGPSAVSTDPANTATLGADSLIYVPTVDLTSYQKESEKGQNNGYAELDGTGKVPANQIPAGIDEVQEFADYASLPATGSPSIIYITVDDNKTYRWGGTVYVELNHSVALGETSTTAYRGDHGLIAYNHSQTTTGNPHNIVISEIPNLQNDLDLKYDKTGGEISGHVLIKTANPTLVLEETAATGSSNIEFLNDSGTLKLGIHYISSSDNTSIVKYAASGTVNTVLELDVDGNIKGIHGSSATPVPTDPKHLTNKEYVDGLISTVLDVYGEHHVVTDGQTSINLLNLGIPGTIRVYRNGLRLLEGTDYNYSPVGFDVELIRPSKATDTIQIDYKH